MRGDSLRDFYAKTLAVLGLGLLAGAGAIVDYWPVNEELPTTPAVAGLVASAPVLVQDLSIQVPAPVVHASRPQPKDFIAPEQSLIDVATSTASAVPAVTLELAPLPADFVVLETIQAVAAHDEFGLETPPLPDSMTEESRRVFGDALRFTKDRIAAAKIILNDAVSGAMSGMKGAFRKMSPFFQTSTVVPGLD